MIPKRRLGSTEMEVTQLGYGTMGLRGPNTWGVRVVDEEHAQRVLNAVLDAGLNFIDTAPDYGIAEHRIGRYISHRRDEFYLATKCGCTPVQHEDYLEIVHTWKPEVIQRNVEESLNRMRTDYIDLLQFHGGTVEELDESGALDCARQLQERGLVRYLGISSSLPEIIAHLEVPAYRTVQLPYSVLQPEHDRVMRQAAERGLGVIVRGGIAHGGPDAEIRREHIEARWQQLRLDELLEPGETRAQFILRFTISHPACHTTIVGTCNLAHLQENLAAVEKGPLPDDVLREIDRRWRQLDPSYCTAD